MIVEYYPERVGDRGKHVLSGQNESGFWRVQLKPGLNELNDTAIANLKSFPGLESYTDRGAIVFRQPAETKFSRTHELEQLYEDQGYAPISEIAIGYGIAKPKSGWKDAIPLIVQYEKEANEAD